MRAADFGAFLCCSGVFKPIHHVVDVQRLATFSRFQVVQFAYVVMDLRVANVREKKNIRKSVECTRRRVVIGLSTPLAYIIILHNAPRVRDNRPGHLLVACSDEGFPRTTLAVSEVLVLCRSWCAYVFSDLVTGL